MNQNILIKSLCISQIILNYPIKIYSLDEDWSPRADRLKINISTDS